MSLQINSTCNNNVSQILLNPDFGDANRCLQAKRAKNSNLHIFETTASIATKFCTVRKTAKYPLWPCGWSKIPNVPQWIDGFWRNLARWCIFPWTLSANEIWEFYIYKMAAATILKKCKIAMSAADWLTLRKLGKVRHLGSADAISQWNFTLEKSKMAAVAHHLEKSQIISRTVWPNLTKYST